MVETSFAQDGYAVIDRLLAPQECEALLNHLPAELADTVGSRCLLTAPWCRSLAERLRRHPALAALLPHDSVATQCTYFSKSASRNWLVPVHQDLSIGVAERIDHPELSGWSEKEGDWFVQPPLALLAQLVAVRLHLDDCGIDDGPLQVVPGTHRSGRWTPEAAAMARRAAPPVSCLTGAGGVVVMRPLLLHASSKSTGQSRRRVLHLVYGPPSLPHGLRWARTA